MIFPAIGAIARSRPITSHAAPATVISCPSKCARSAALVDCDAIQPSLCRPLLAIPMKFLGIVLPVPPDSKIEGAIFNPFGLDKHMIVAPNSFPQFRVDGP